VSGRNLAAEVGQLLRTTREMRGLSQSRLATRAGISQQRLSMMERGSVDARLGDLQRLFGGMGLRLRMEAVPLASGAVDDPELVVGVPSDERAGTVGSYCHLLGKLQDVPHVVGGRLAAFAHGLPVRVRRLDLLVANDDRELFTHALYRFSTQRWSERWQAFCNDAPPDRPGPMRWQISGVWELRVALVDDLPERVTVELAGRQLWVPPLPWLVGNDPDVADLLGRLTAAGWTRPAGLPAEG
jgi:transcriptional regulator with XRE-family HTH domain